MSTQTAEYSDMVKRHVNEMHALRKAQLVEQTELMRKLIEQSHKMQIAGLKNKLET